MNNPSIVAFVKCLDYGQGLDTVIARAIELCEWQGVDDLTGKRVLVKPNLLTERTPEQAVTTHPGFVRAVIRWFKARGAQVTVGDSPASVANLKNVWERSGLATVCAEEGVPLISFEQAGVQSCEIDGFSFSVAQPVMEADLLVNLPKVKAHVLTTLTAAVKNMYGVLPGYSKTTFHRTYANMGQFGRFVATIWKALPPSVTIADGVVGMEGQGPSNGRPVSLGFVAVSQDPFAMDRALCSLLKINPRSVPYLIDDLGAKYLCVGDTINVPSFALPAGGSILRRLQCFRSLSQFLLWVRPAFSETACIQCGKCIKACPVHAIRLETGMPVPHLTPKTCIGCCCCHEVCPADAIRMTQSWILRMAKVFKGLD